MKIICRKTSRKTGHYTQLVWADTTKIGCGRIKYKDEKNWDTILLVCNYGPCGNRIGDKIYETVKKKKKSNRQQR